MLSVTLNYEHSAHVQTGPARKIPSKGAASSHILKQALECSFEVRRALGDMLYHCKWGTHRVLAVLAPPAMKSGQFGEAVVPVLVIPVDELSRKTEVKNTSQSTTWDFWRKITNSVIVLQWGQAKVGLLHTHDRDQYGMPPGYHGFHAYRHKDHVKALVNNVGIPKWGGKGDPPEEDDTHNSSLAVLEVMLAGVTFDHVVEEALVRLIHAPQPNKKEKASWESLLAEET